MINEKAFLILWQYCRDEPVLADDDVITNFNENNAIADLFKIKEKITGQTGDNGTKNNGTIKISEEFLENS